MLPTVVMISRSRGLALLIQAMLVFTAMTFVVSLSFRSYRWDVSKQSRLGGHVIASTFPVSVISCMVMCITNSSCWTVNYRVSDGMCELNDVDDRWKDVTAITPSKDFNFYRKRIPRGPQDIDKSLLSQVLQCKTGHILLGNSCLELVPDNGTTANFSGAKIICDHKLGRLAVLDTAVLQGILSQLAPYSQNARFYIDIVRASSTAMMYGATKTLCNITTPPWAPGQPDNYPYGSGPEDCGSIEKGPWNYPYAFLDVPCDLQRGYICQYGMLNATCFGA